MMTATLLTDITKLGVYELVQPHGGQLDKITNLLKSDHRFHKWPVEPYERQDSIMWIIDVKKLYGFQLIRSLQVQ